MRFWYSTFLPEWNNDSVGIYDMSVEDVMILKGKEWKEFSNPAIQWAFPFYKLNLRAPNKNDFNYIKIEDNDGKVFYFFKQKITGAAASNSDGIIYEWDYEMDLWGSIFYTWWKELKEINPDVYFKRCFKNRFLVGEIGKYINILEQFWFQKIIPNDYPLNNQSIINYDQYDLNTFNNKSPSTKYYNTDEDIYNFIIEQQPAFNAIIYSDIGTIEAVKQGLNLIVLNQQWDELVNNNTINISFETKPLANPWNSKSTMIWNWSSTLREKPEARGLLFDIEYKHHLIAKDVSDWVGNKLFMIDGTKIKIVDDTKDYFDIILDGTTNYIAFNGTNHGGVLRVFLKDVGTYRKYEIAYIADADFTTAEGCVIKVNMNIPTTIMTYIAPPGTNDVITINSDEWMKQHRNGKYFYLVLKSSAIEPRLNTQYAKKSELIEQNQILLPLIVNDLDYLLDDGTSLTLTRDSYMSALTNYTNQAPTTETGLLVANDTTIDAVFQSTLNPLLLFPNLNRWNYFKQPVSAEATEAVPLFFTRIDPWSYRNSFNLEIDLSDIMDISDYSTWNKLNEPYLINSQFNKLKIKWDNSNELEIPYYWTNIPNSNVIQLTFNTILDNQVMLNLDETILTNQLFMNQNNCTYFSNYSSPISWNTSAYNNWILSNASSEQTARANLKDSLQQITNNEISQGIGAAAGVVGATIGAVGDFTPTFNNKGEQTNKPGKGVSKIVDSAAGLARLGFNIKNEEITKQIMKRNLDSTYANLRNAGVSTTSSPFYLNNTTYNGSNDFKIFLYTIWDEQKDTIFNEVVNYGYIYENMQPLILYDNRLNYNVIQLNLSFNYDEINRGLTEKLENDIWNNQETRDAFYSFLGRVHRLYKVDINTDNIISGNIEAHEIEGFYDFEISDILISQDDYFNQKLITLNVPVNFYNIPAEAQNLDIQYDPVDGLNINWDGANKQIVIKYQVGLESINQDVNLKTNITGAGTVNFNYDFIIAGTTPFPIDLNTILIIKDCGLIWTYEVDTFNDTGAANTYIDELGELNKLNDKVIELLKQHTTLTPGDGVATCKYNPILTGDGIAYNGNIQIMGLFNISPSIWSSEDAIIEMYGSDKYILGTVDNNKINYDNIFKSNDDNFICCSDDFPIPFDNLIINFNNQTADIATLSHYHKYSRIHGTIIYQINNGDGDYKFINYVLDGNGSDVGVNITFNNIIMEYSIINLSDTSINVSPIYLNAYSLHLTNLVQCEIFITYDAGVAIYLEYVNINSCPDIAGEIYKQTSSADSGVKADDDSKNSELYKWMLSSGWHD